MAKKSQAIAVLEGRLTLLKVEETKARQTLAKFESLRETLEDLLKSIKAAVAGAKGGRGKQRLHGNSVPVRQAVVESFNKQAQAGFNAGFNKAQADAVAKEQAAERQQNDSKASSA